MVSIFDAIVLDWWMFAKTDIFGLLIKVKTGKKPDIMRVDPQWDGKEFLKLISEVIISGVLANNMDTFLLFLSFYETSDHRMAGEAIDEIIADLYVWLKFLNGIMNINRPQNPGVRYH